MKIRSTLLRRKPAAKPDKDSAFDSLTVGFARYMETADGCRKTDRVPIRAP